MNSQKIIKIKSWTECADNYFSKQLQEMCNQFFSKDMINYFSITKIYKDRTFSDFCTDLAFQSKTAKLVDYNSLIDLENFVSDTCLDRNFTIWNINNLFEDTPVQKIYELCREFNYLRGITISQFFPTNKSTTGYIENYHFSSPKKDGSAEKYFIENYDLLIKFIFFVKEKIYSDRILNNIFSNRYLIESKTKPLNLNFDADSDDKEIVLAENSFNINRFYIKNDLYLTKKELIVIKYLLQFYSSKDIAQEMNISFRTAQTHIENIKIKTNCDSIRKLFQFIQSQKILVDFIRYSSHFKELGE